MCSNMTGIDCADPSADEVVAEKMSSTLKKSSIAPECDLGRVMRLRRSDDGS